MRRVVIFQYRLLHYRKQLFEQLRQQCASRDIELILVHGRATRREAAKRDEASLPWALTVENRVWEVGPRDLIWQPFPRSVADADLVIVMQESRILSNYPILLNRLWSSRRVAFWGHGRNLQSDRPDGLRERWKKMLVGRVDWWFAYTELTRSILLADGFPDERVTVLGNAIDNKGFQNDLSSIAESEISQLRSELGATQDSPIGLFCGSLYPDKRLDFLIAAADLVHGAIPGFRFVVIGDGPSASEVERAAQLRPWMRWVGARTGREKAAYFRVSSIVMNPGAVGLHVLDAFCAGLPLVTTVTAKHGPEIAYLRNASNGLIVNGDASDYAKAIVELLGKSKLWDEMRANALTSAQQYTLENMTARFANGIAACLSQ